MTRPIDSTFLYVVDTLKVVEGNEWKCYSCYFYGKCDKRLKLITGPCDSAHRTDGNSVLFVDTRKNITVLT